MTELFNRSQMARLDIVEGLLVSIMEEFEVGMIDLNIMQTAVNCQIEINRIVWKLNMQMERKEE